MPLIKYIEANGKTIEVDVPTGTSLMEAAVENMVSGITADCGGGCSCGTCHCFIEEARLAEIPEPDPIEQSILDMISDTKANSRLCCQIYASEAMAGMVVYVPEES